MKHKKYEIDTLDKLVNAANRENIERLSIDFLLWLNYVVNFIDEVRKQHPELKDKQNTEIINECMFKWTDDGKNDINGVEIKNKKTGEVTYVNLKKRAD